MASNSMSMELATGIYQFKIDYSKAEEACIGGHITSPKFSAGGHDWILVYYPHGPGKVPAGEYISLYLRHLDVCKNVTVNYVFGLLDKYHQPKIWKRGTDEFNGFSSIGWPKFIQKSQLEAKYLSGDHIVIICTITKINEPCAIFTSLFPHNLSEQLRGTLMEQENTDVTFEADGRVFYAHRVILASRSPVFRALLFGPLAENESGIIGITDMKASIFEAVLHFIYTDSIPEIEDLFMTDVAFIQSLLVAADRYALQGLLELCEKILRRSISIDTVMSTLGVAEKHQQAELKDDCIEFIICPENLTRVILSEEGFHLMQSYPSLLAKIREGVYGEAST